GRINPFGVEGMSGVSSLSGAFGASTLATGALFCGTGAVALSCGTGAFGNSFFGGSGCGVGEGGWTGGAIRFKTFGSTLTDSWGAGATLGEGFNASNAPGGNSTVICRRAMSSSSLVRTCGRK